MFTFYFDVLNLTWVNTQQILARLGVKDLEKDPPYQWDASVSVLSYFVYLYCLYIFYSWFIKILIRLRFNFQLFDIFWGLISAILRFHGNFKWLDNACHVIPTGESYSSLWLVANPIWPRTNPFSIISVWICTVIKYILATMSTRSARTTRLKTRNLRKKVQSKSTSSKYRNTGEYDQCRTGSDWRVTRSKIIKFTHFNL